MKKILFLMVALLSLGCSGDDEGGVNSPVEPEVELPVAVDDEFATTENTVLKIDGLLDNDTVHDYAGITSFEDETSEGGSVIDNRDGTYTYTPPSNFMGEDSFEYTMCDNASPRNCSSANVTINVTAASPEAVDDVYETQEEKILKIISHLSNDDMADNAEITSVGTEGTHGTVVLEDDGDILYTPADGFAGEDSFTYTICDDDETPTCSTATILINVIDEGSPQAVDDEITVSFGAGSTTMNRLLNNDSVLDDAVISSVEATGNGNIVLNENGTVVYTPQAGFTGTDSFTYTLCDDDSPEPTCSTATVTVNVVESVAFNIPEDIQEYYSDFFLTTNTETNYVLLSALTEDSHTRILSYGERHDYLYNADASLENPDNVVLMYSGEERFWKEYTSGNNTYSPQTFNTEHIYPQSRLSSDFAATDLHHLRVAADDVNSLRLNYPYADGSGEYGLVGNDAWYPGDEWKGDVARMIMYLNIRYGETFNKVGNIELFLKWNAEDPVSAFELQRNNVIESAQGNRNPFIDNPYFATLLWGGPEAENRWE